MSDIAVSIVLGLLEGFTEFLPISSTAHLLLAEHWVGHQTELFNITVQAGAILAVAVVYRHRLWVLLGAVWAPRTASRAARAEEPPAREYLGRLALAFGVTAVLGLLVKGLGWELSHELTPIAWALILGAIWMLIAEHIGAHRQSRNKGGTSITCTAAFLVGIAQVMAGVFPGTSRSAAAIFVVLLMGKCERAAAADFVFIVGIPTILGATLYSLVTTLSHQTLSDIPWANLGSGFAAAFVAALCAVRWLLAFLHAHKFTGFAIYRLVLGAGLLLWNPVR